MLPMARAELLLQQRSNDPLAALPAPLRLPLRQQLKRKTASFGAARVVVMPLPKLQTQLDVPLVRSATGDVDVYADTVPPAIANSLEQWLNNLEPLPPGQVQALLVKLTPWPATDASE